MPMFNLTSQNNDHISTSPEGWLRENAFWKKVRKLFPDIPYQAQSSKVVLIGSILTHCPAAKPGGVRAQGGFHT